MSSTITSAIVLIWVVMNLVGVVYGIMAYSAAVADVNKMSRLHPRNSPEWIYSTRQKLKIGILATAALANVAAGVVSALFPSRVYGDWARWTVLIGLILGALGTDIVLVLINRTRIQIAAAVERERQEQQR